MELVLQELDTRVTMLDRERRELQLRLVRV